MAIARVDKLDLLLSSHQRFQRQCSRFLGMVKNIFGGKKNLQQFWSLISLFTACCS